MRAHFGLPSVVSEETEGKPPIQVKFEIPYFTTSGIQVLYLWTTVLSLTPSRRSRQELFNRYPFFFSIRFATWRLSRRAAIKPYPGCATLRKTATTSCEPTDEKRVLHFFFLINNLAPIHSLYLIGMNWKIKAWSRDEGRTTHTQTHISIYYYYFSIRFLLKGGRNRKRRTKINIKLSFFLRIV